MSEELLTNANHPQFDWDFSSKFTEVKKGCRIEILYVDRGGDLICYLIKVRHIPTAKEKADAEKKKQEQQRGDFNFSPTEGGKG